MIDSLMTDRDGTLDLIVEKLGMVPNDFYDRDNRNRQQTRQDRRLTAGVLFPLHFGNEGFVVHLIKRSKLVPQAGDLGFPGGMLDPFLDRLIMYCMGLRCPPVMTGKPLRYARRRGRSSLSTIRLFLANALRESWEEVRLNPLKVTFLGPLPSYDLVLFERSIFPLVGFIEDTPRFHANEEVEKIVAIPLRSFFDDANYAAGIFRKPDGGIHRRDDSDAFPCFIYVDQDRRSEILWGATFQIIMSFLSIVFGHDIPPSHEERIFEIKIPHSYMSGASKA